MKYLIALVALAIVGFVSVQSYKAFNAAKVSNVAVCENPACGNAPSSAQ